MSAFGIAFWGKVLLAALALFTVGVLALGIVLARRYPKESKE